MVMLKNQNEVHLTLQGFIVTAQKKKKKNSSNYLQSHSYKSSLSCTIMPHTTNTHLS